MSAADLILNAVITIPVSIGCGLALPFVQRWINRRGTLKTAKQLEQAERDYREALVYKNEPLYLIQNLIIRSALAIIAAIFMLCGLGLSLHAKSMMELEESHVIYVIHPITGRVEAIGLAIAGALTMFAGSWRMTNAMEAMIDGWGRATNFDRYEEIVPEAIKLKYNRPKDASTSSSE